MCAPFLVNVKYVLLRVKNEFFLLDFITEVNLKLSNFYNNLNQKKKLRFLNREEVPVEYRSPGRSPCWPTSKTRPARSISFCIYLSFVFVDRCKPNYPNPVLSLTKQRNMSVFFSESYEYSTLFYRRIPLRFRQEKKKNQLYF